MSSLYERGLAFVTASMLTACAGSASSPGASGILPGSAATALEPAATTHHGKGKRHRPLTSTPICDQFSSYGALDYCYLMNDPSGYVLHDSSSAGNDGTIATQPYVSGMINSYPNYTFTYGYFEERAQLPYGQGLWPAFWLYGISGGAEIDVMEMYGSQALGTMTSVYQTVQNCSGCQEVYTGINPTTGYHRYGAQWTPSQVTFFVDGTQTASYEYATSTPMYLITNLSVVGPAWGANYQPAASEFPAVMRVSNINAYNPSGTCSASLPTGTGPLPPGNICVNGTNYVPAIPPTDDFRTFNHYDTKNPGGTWQTKFWWNARTNNGPYGAVFYADNTASGFKIFPFQAASGLTITAKAARKRISGYGAPPLASGSSGSLKTLGVEHDICSSCGSDYLESGYTPASGSFSLTCYVSVPPIVSGYPLLLGTGNPAWTNNEGFSVVSDPFGDLYFNVGYGTGTSTATLWGGLQNSKPESMTLTYDAASGVATIYLGDTSSPASTSVTLPSPYVASGSKLYFNAGMYDFYQGATFDDCAEWDGTVLTAGQVDAIASRTL